MLGRRLGQAGQGVGVLFAQPDRFGLYGR